MTETTDHSTHDTARFSVRLLVISIHYIEDVHGPNMLKTYMDRLKAVWPDMASDILEAGHSWVEWHILDCAYQIGIELTGDPRFILHVGQWAITRRRLSSANRKLHDAGSVQGAYAKAVELAMTVTQDFGTVSHEIEDRNHCRIIYQNKFSAGSVFREYPEGVYSAMPVLFGYPKAKVDCQQRTLPDGTEELTFSMSWLETPRYHLWGLCAGAMLGAGWIAAFGAWASSAWFGLFFLITSLLIVKMFYIVGRRRKNERLWHFDQNVLEGQIRSVAADQRILKERNQALLKIKISLEDMVEEATRHLAEQNLELRKANEKILRTQDRLIHSEKLAGVGQLAGGIAHEFNNILAGMQGYAELALPKAEDDRVKKALEVVLVSSRRAKRIVQGLLTFSHKSRPVFEVMDLVDVLSATVHLVNSDYRKADIVVSKDYKATPRIVGDPGQIQQVFLNILTNARHALDGVDQKRVVISLNLDDDMAVVTIGDNGCGISRENVSKIFDPFFSSRAGRQAAKSLGTGLGLAISSSIMIKHHGRITVDSRVGDGSTFSIYFPMDDPALSTQVRRVEVISHDDREVEAQQLVGTILVVDDEPLVRDVVCEMLKQDGFDVTSAQDGEEAIERAKTQRFDLVILDVMLPGMNGPDIFLALKRICQDQLIIMMTGQVGDALSDLAEVMQRSAEVRFLRKPFSHAELLASVKETLGIKEPDHA